MDNKLTTSPPLNRPSQNNSSCYSDTNGSTHSHLCPYFWHNSIQLYFATGVCERVCLSFWCLGVPPIKIRCHPLHAKSVSFFFRVCLWIVRIVSGALSHTLHQNSFLFFNFLCFFRCPPFFNDFPSMWHSSMHAQAHTPKQYTFLSFVFVHMHTFFSLHLHAR